MLKDVAEAEGLTPAQAQALRFVTRTKTFMASVGNLAAALGTSHVTAVKVAAGLERRGLLERTTSVLDRRVTLLSLTRAGEEAVERLLALERSLEQAVSALTPDERLGLERSLGAIVGALKSAGLLVVAEPCRGCVHFVENAAPGAPEPHRCRLIERFLSEREALLACPDHEPVAA